MHIVLLINGKKIDLSNRILSFQIIDQMSDSLDSFNINLSNADLNFDIPSNRQATLGLIINNFNMGEFNVTFININASVLKIEAASCDYNLGKVKRTNVFKNVTLNNILTNSANFMGLKLNIDSQLKNKKIDYFIQDNKNDLELLNELGQIYGAIATIKNKELLFIYKYKQQEIISLEKQHLISIYQEDVKDKQIYNGVKGSYWDFNTATNVEISLGSSPFLHMTNTYPKTLFHELIQSKYHDIKENKLLHVTCGGKISLQAGLNLKLQQVNDFKDFQGIYRINKVIHKFNGKKFTSNMELVKTN